MGARDAITDFRRLAFLSQRMACAESAKRQYGKPCESRHALGLWLVCD